LSGHEQHDKSIWWLVIEKQLKYTFLFQNSKLKKIKYLIEYLIYVNIFSYWTKIHKKLVTGHDKKLNFSGHQLNKLVTKSTGQAGHGLVLTKLVIKASRPQFY
jgi:hypothetical protein